MGAFEKNLRARLKQAAAGDGDQAKLEQTIVLAQAVYRSQQQADLSFRGLLLSQVRFLGWKIWLGQAGLLLVLGVLLGSFGSHHAVYILTRHGPYLLSCCATLILTMTLPLVHRSRRWQMDEVEAATAYSTQGLLGARILLLFVGDALLLLAVGLLAAANTVLAPEKIALYLLMPFLGLAVGYMAMLSKRSGQRLEMPVLVMSGLVLGGLSWLDVRWPEFYSGSFNKSWLVVSLLLFAVIVNQWLGVKKHSGGWS